MNHPLLFLVAVLAIAGVLWWLWQANRRDLEDLGRQIGLAPVGEPVVERVAGRGPGNQTKLLAGEREGRPVEIWRRHVRARRQPASRAGRAHTVVVRPLGRTTGRAPVLVEPRFRSALLDLRFGGPPEVDLGDEAFQAVFRVVSEDPGGAQVLVGPAVRAALMGLRSRWLGSHGAGGLGLLADAAALGWLEVESARVAYAIPGTPAPALAPRILDALAVLDAVARAAERDTGIA